MLDKLKINAKIRIVLAVTLLFSVGITILGVVSMQTMSLNSNKSYNMTTLPLGYLNNMATILGQIRIDLRELTVNSDEEITNNLSEEITSLVNLFKENLSTCELVLGSAEGKDSIEFDKFNELKASSELLIPQIEETRALAMAGNKGEALNYMYINVNPANENLENKMNSLIRDVTLKAESFAKDNEDNRSKMTIMFIIIWVVSIIVSIILSRIVSNSISKPVGKIVDAMDKLCKGEIDPIVADNNPTETSKLSRSYVMVTDILKNLLESINVFSEKIAQGEMDYRIDEKEFDGAFQDVAKGINNMVNIEDQTTRDILDILNEFGNGNFSAKLKEMPGKKIIINETVEELRNNLVEINDEITSLVNAAIEGDLTKRALTENSKGDWKQILIGLNNFIDAVVAPIDEASKVLIEFSEGNLSASINGDYKGKFALIKNSMNKTISSIKTYVSDIDRVLEELANNNFDVDLDISYVGDFVTIRNSLEMIISKLSNVVMEIGNSAQIVAEGAREVTSNSEILSNGAVQQNIAVDEVAEVVSKINSQISSSAEKAKDANVFANESKSNAQLGNQEMQELLESMDAIEHSSNNISRIIKVIDDIAFQTNLLALNAAVEAARAGVHGKGFSIVAEEVRNLANKSKEAADETSQLIENSISRVKVGTEKAKTTAASLEKIVEHVNEVSYLISDIANLSEEQKSEINIINNGIDKIDKVVKLNVDGSQRGTSIAEELLNESEELKEMLARFKIKSV